MELPPIFDYHYMEKLYNSVVLQAAPAVPKTLRIEQADGIYKLLQGRDLLLILPTGFGKSLVYMVPGMIKAKLEGVRTKTVIVAPLTALINNAIRKLKSFNLKAFHIGTENDIVTAIQESGDEPVYLFLSPEVLIKVKTKRQVTEIQPDFLIVDEGHVSAEWSKGFRNDYGCIYEIRACVACPLAVLTATMTDNLISEVKMKTGLKESLYTIAIRPDRPNIYLEVREGANKGEYMKEIATEIREQNIRMKKTLIFVTSQNTTADTYVDLKKIIGDDVNYSVAGKLVGRIVNFYHADTDETTKTNIELAFEKPNGVLRCLICTVAFGMGVDIADVKRVIIWGTPTSPMMMWQQIGRVGRDGTQSQAIIFPFKAPGPYGTQTWTPNTSGCFRKYMMTFFYGRENISTYELEGQHICCSFCRVKSTSQGNKEKQSLGVLTSKLKGLLK